MEINYEIYDFREYRYGIEILPTNLYSLLSIFIVFLFSFLSVYYLSKKININKKISIAILIWHTLFSIVYIVYILTETGDSLKFFHRSLNELYFFKLNQAFGSKFVITITSLFSNFLSFNYIAVNLIFNLMGVVGLLLIYDVLNKNKIFYRYYIIILLFIFMPSLSFWSSSIGKDSISLLSIAILLWSIYNAKKSFFLKYFSLFLLFLVRPHYAIIGIAIFSFVDFFFKKSSIKITFLKLFTIFSILLIGPSVFNFMIHYVGYYSVTAETSFNLSGFLDFIEIRSRYAESNSFYDVKSMTSVTKIFTYLFRPLPYEANNLFQLFVSIENFIIFIMIFYLSIIKVLQKTQYFEIDKFALLFFTLIYLVILSYTTANFGIANRQKWLVLVMIFVMLTTKHKKNNV